MSIEQKIAQILAESRASEQIEEGANPNNGDRAPIRSAAQAIGPEDEVQGEPNTGRDETNPVNGPTSMKHETHEANPENAKNNVQDEHEAEAAGKGKKPNQATKNAAAGDQAVIRQGNTVKEDIEALVYGEDLSEEFKEKATTIFEAAIITRVKEEVSRLEEEFEARLEEALAQNQEGLVEKVDGYLDYVVEQWMSDNEIALERGIKTEMLESFVGGLKGLFEEHNIDVPEEKYDLIGELEETIEQLHSKLDEQVAINVEMNSILAESVREQIVSEACEGLTDTEVEKFVGLVEELSFEDADTFANKVATIRENYFTGAASKTIVESVITDEPVSLNEEAVVSTDANVNRYVKALNILNK